MSSARTLAFAALLAALASVGCDCGGEGPERASVPPEEAAYAKEMDDVTAERKRLTAALREAQESGDAGKLAAAADALNENRKRAAAAVREHVNLQSSKKQEK